MTKIWQRYIFRELFKVFFLFLFGFYFLYIVIDYSTHMQDFALGKPLHFGHIVTYYLLQFIKRMDILLPLALLIGSIKVLCQLNVHRELLAFQSAGIRIKMLLRPFFLLGFCIVGINLLVNEYAVPYSLNFIDKFHDAHLRHSFRGSRTEPLHVLHIDDQSKLIYQHYDLAKEAFFDVIWIKNPKDLWRMRYLYPNLTYPEGQWVDHLEQMENGCFEKTQSFSSLMFHDLKWNKDLPRQGYIPFENRSISTLWKTLKIDLSLPSFEKQEVLTQLLFKLAMPFSSLLVLIVLIPSCITYSRTLPQFFIYSVALFSFVAFIALMDAFVILGESGTISPFAAILAPFFVSFLFFGWRFIKA